MGLELLGGPNEPFDLTRAIKAVLEVITSPSESIRRKEMHDSVALYRDDYESVLQEVIGNVFDAQAVRQRLYQLIRLAGHSSFLKRVSDEIARPIYAQPPTRHLYKKGERVPKGRPMPDPSSASDLPRPGPAPGAEEVGKARETFQDLAQSAGWNGAMDTAARLLVGCPPVFIVGRNVASMGPVLDVVTGDVSSVIPHPDRVTVPLAFIYDKVSVTPTGAAVISHVVVDDKRSFEISSSGLPMGPVKEHDLGRLPIVVIMPRGHWGSFWPTRGRDLRSASLAAMFIDVVTMKKHKSQSHLQLAATGEGVSGGTPKNQILDEESILILEGAGVNISTIDLQADPTGLHKTADRIMTTTAANYGLSLDRLNQKSTMEQNSALNERTSEAAGVMVDAERAAFDLLCRLSMANEDASKRLDPEKWRLSVDYRALSMRMEPKAERELWDMDIKAGIRDQLDNVFATNPEITTEAEAWAFLDQKLANRAAWVVRARALNLSADANGEQIGQTPQQNGAMGPEVRDGLKTKDKAAEQAKGPQPPDDKPGETPEEN
jgi:hypothetical protein